MSNNQKSIQTPKIKPNLNLSKNNNINKENNISDTFPFFSLSESPSSHNSRLKSYSESNTKIKGVTNNPQQNINMNLSTNYQTFSRNNQIEEENELNLGAKINNEYDFDNSSSNLDSYNNNYISKKPRLSLKDSRTKLKQLRDKLYPLSEEQKIMEQEKLLPVPLNKMNDEKYKLLKMHHLKKKSLPEYKSCTKFEDYYKPFEKSLERKNEFYLLKRKKPIYSNNKSMVLEFSLKNKNKEINFPLYKDQEIGIYEYWQVPLIESKVDEDIDSDEEQINLAKKVCHLDLQEGIKYIEKNGIEDIISGFQKENNKSLNKSISV